MSQNVIHQNVVALIEAFTDDLDELDDGHDGAQVRQACSDPHTLEEDRPAGAQDHREAHAQGDRAALCATQTASASPTLAIKAPWARMVVISRQAAKSNAPSDNSS